jgi:hypothetical protein
MEVGCPSEWRAAGTWAFGLSDGGAVAVQLFSTPRVIRQTLVCTTSGTQRRVVGRRDPRHDCLIQELWEALQTDHGRRRTKISGQPD